MRDILHPWEKHRAKGAALPLLYYFLFCTPIVALISLIPQIVVEKSAFMAYNIFNKEADTIADTYLFPAKAMNKNSTLLCQSGGAIFYG